MPYSWAEKKHLNWLLWKEISRFVTLLFHFFVCFISCECDWKVLLVVEWKLKWCDWNALHEPVDFMSKFRLIDIETVCSCGCTLFSGTFNHHNRKKENADTKVMLIVIYSSMNKNVKIEIWNFKCQMNPLKFVWLRFIHELPSHLT